MKKFLIISLSIISSLFLVDTAKAETKEFEFFNGEYNGYVYSSYSPFNVYSSFNQDLLDDIEQKMVDYWNKNLKSHHPYYYISLSYEPYSSSAGTSFEIKMALTAFKAIPIDYTSLHSMSCDYENYKNEHVSFEDKIQLTYYYTYTLNNIFSSEPYGLYCDNNNLFYESSDFGNFYLPLWYYSSNYDQPFGLDDTYVVKKGDETLFTLNKEDIVPTYKDKFIDRTDLNYIEVDLNSHPYVVLSLKDYNKTEEFSFNTYVKGQYCLTPVYDYGLREKKEVLSGSKNQRCSPYYDNYTPVRTYVLESDLKNHAIYYLKAQDTTKENKVKIDTSIFNIHYISEEEKDNPIITINGKKYSITPFDELTDTANKSEDEGYNSGAVCAVGDFNCTRNTLGVKETSWSDIFSSPLEFLKNIWTSITQVFVIITYFIALLPTTLQYFLYISFMLAIILGIIKIIL